MTKKKSRKPSAEKTIRNIRRNSRRQYSGEEKIRVVLEGLRGEESIAELCRREGISQCDGVVAHPNEESLPRLKRPIYSAHQHPAPLTQSKNRFRD